MGFPQRIGAVVYVIKKVPGFVVSIPGFVVSIPGRTRSFVIDVATLDKSVIDDTGGRQAPSIWGRSPDERAYAGSIRNIALSDFDPSQACASISLMFNPGNSPDPTAMNPSLPPAAQPSEKSSEETYGGQSR
ncbi:MAG: hypothetical protein V1659_00470 [Candidatus Woesearchaeota archaeon]